MAPPPRIVTLVVDELSGVLPPFEVISPWWMEAGPVVNQAKLQFGIDITVVRLLDGERFPGGPVTYLVEADGVDADDLAPFAGHLSDDPRRPAYAEVGGVASLVDWADGELARTAIEREGPATQFRTWNLSCLIRVPTTDGELWLKAVPDFFAHEGDVMAALAAADPTLVPEVVAARPGTTLMKHAGDADGYAVGPDAHFESVARFHRAATSIDLTGLGSVPRFDLDALVASLSDLDRRHGQDLEVGERERMARLIDECGDRWRAAGPVDDALVHGDLHGGNLRLADDGPDVIIDWGDSAVTHPLFDLVVLDSYTPDWPSSATDRWLDLLGVGRSEWQAFRPLASMRQAIVYRGFCDSIEASERIYHINDIVPALRKGLSTLE